MYHRAIVILVAIAIVSSTSSFIFVSATAGDHGPEKRDKHEEGFRAGAHNPDQHETLGDSPVEDHGPAITHAEYRALSDKIKDAPTDKGDASFFQFIANFMTFFLPRQPGSQKMCAPPEQQPARTLIQDYLCVEVGNTHKDRSSPEDACCWQHKDADEVGLLPYECCSNEGWHKYKCSELISTLCDKYISRGPIPSDEDL